MAPWTALNIEPESDIEDVEYDNTKEIQIEEALKLYQSALKLHSQGPKYYEEAAKAYDVLFDSEIFKYSESRSELSRLAALSASDEFEDEGVVLSLDDGGGQDSAPSTLPQILYLSFKNRGQFILDQLINQIRNYDTETAKTTQAQSQDIVTAALYMLSDALDKDSSDTDLWQRVAKLTNYLGSQRISKFVLESSFLDGDQDDADLFDGIDLNTLAIQHELEKTTATIEARVPRPGQHEFLAEKLAARFNALDILPAAQHSKISTGLPQISQKTIDVASRSWQAIAEAILETRQDEVEEQSAAFSLYVLDIPDKVEDSVMIIKSPTLITAESFSKRRLSRSPVTPFKTLPTNLSTRHTGTPAVRSKAAVLIRQGTDEDTAVSDSTGQVKDELNLPIAPSTEPRPPTKRNSDLAGLQDTPDGGVRSRSKRLRARAETLADDIPDPKAVNKQIEEQLGVYSRADDWVFSVAYEIGCRFGCKWIGSAETIRDASFSNDNDQDTDSSLSDPKKAPLRDFMHAISTWNANKSGLLLHGAGIGASAVLIDDGSDSGFASFMERTKNDARRAGGVVDELTDQCVNLFATQVQGEYRDLDRLALIWIDVLLQPVPISPTNFGSNYDRYLWSAEFKEIVAQVIAEFDETIYHFALAKYEDHIEDVVKLPTDTLGQAQNPVFIQTIFELQVDFYAKMTAPDSRYDQPSRAAQRQRMSNWASLANRAISTYCVKWEGKPMTVELVLRFLWTQIVFIGLVDASARDHILLCYKDLQQVFLEQTSQGLESPVYHLPNNSAIPEISLDALEQELSKEKTMDFFQGIFGTESKDPVTLIENLEPVLMQTFNSHKNDFLNREKPVVGIKHQSNRSSRQDTVDPGSRARTPTHELPAESSDSQLVEFIQNATVQLRLSLWHQLKGAYNRIEYPGMKVVCNFRSIILILRELHGTPYANEEPEARAGNLIIWLRNLADLVSQTLDTIKSHAKALDCLAEDNLDLALEACSLATRLFHVFSLWDDAVRIGQLPAPVAPGPAVTYKNAMTFLREMQPKVWHLLYLVYREAFSQDLSLAEESPDDLIELLRAIHCAFGNREYCRVGRKGLMKLIKSELLRLDGPEEEIAQALYDLYGLKITQHPNSIWEHGCTGDTIDRMSALEVVEYVMAQAKSMNVRDLLKSDIKIVAEKMQAVIGIPRAGASTTHQSFNRRLVTNYLKGPILPSKMKSSLKGLEGLSTMTIKTDYAVVASKRWFFLIGFLHLAKYRSTKRVAPDDGGLDDAITFLKLDLDFDTSNWETWMRLGQAYDSKLDEEVLWDASVINEKPEELVQFERYAIHCYEMAVSLSKHSADDTRETQLKLGELYADFATRLYSSTREPFNSKVFDVSGHEKYINQADKGTYQIAAYQGFSSTTIWKICDRMYERALEEKMDDDWFIWYMRGKCRWKLLQAAQEAQPSWTHPVEAFVKAVENVPEKRDSRHPDKEPILEPHYKLLSVVHKLLKLGAIKPEESIRVLQTSHHSRKIQLDDESNCERFIIEFLQVLRTADKSNWHHRMIAKAARIAYDGNFNPQAAAQAAKDRFSQHILTKAMAIQIWKPEYERPGRHFVYTTRYVRFIIKILEELGERPVVETLGKRVRKKQNEYIDAADIFDHICEAHMRLVRIQGSIPERSEDRVFHHGMTFEYFTLNAGRLETWANSQLSLTNIKLPLLSEVWELKKLSGTLLEKAPFEELMMDIYACLFETVVPELIARAGEAENREKMRIDRMLMDTDTNQSGQASATETTAAPSRLKQISKTEVRRRSEALVTKPPASVTKGKTGPVKDSSPAPMLKPKPSAHRTSKDTYGPSSPTASLHDSADGESELSSIADSDLEDMDTPAKPVLFHNVVNREASVVSEGTVEAPQSTAEGA